MLHRNPLTLWLLTAVLGLAACASQGIALDTFDKKVAAAYASVQTIAEGGQAALAAGKISKADAQNIVVSSRAAIAAIDVASSMKASNPAGADAKLASALVILQALQAYLTTQGAKP
jgi:hypothetical protein